MLCCAAKVSFVFEERVRALSRALCVHVCVYIATHLLQHPTRPLKEGSGILVHIHTHLYIAQQRHTFVIATAQTIACEGWNSPIHAHRD